MPQIIHLNIAAEAAYFSISVTLFAIILALRIKAVKQLTKLGLWHEKYQSLNYLWLRYRKWVAKQKMKAKI